MPPLPHVMGEGRGLYNELAETRWFLDHPLPELVETHEVRPPQTVSPLLLEIWSELTGKSLDARLTKIAESRPEAIKLSMLLQTHGSEWLWRIGRTCVEGDREHGAVLRFTRWLDAAVKQDSQSPGRPAM